MPRKYESEKYREIHTKAKEHFKEILEFEGPQRRLMADDKAFGLGEDDSQWDALDVKSRKLSGRSYLTIMRSNQFTDHVKNQQRQNKPSIKISPEDEGASQDIAELHQAIIKQIQYESKANQARQAGFDDAVDEGRGHWILRTEYVKGTMNQKIIIEPVPDSRRIFMDIRRKRPDYSDCKHGFYLVPIPKEEFEDKYPNANLDNWDQSDKNVWVTQKDVIIAEYFCEKIRNRKLLEVIEGDQSRLVYEDELEVEKDTLTIGKSRTVEEPYWMWYKMTGNEILDHEKLPWNGIPIITCIAKETIKDGDWVCKGLLRDIKAPLRMYNFLSSNEADIIAKAPRAPWVGAEGQFEGHEQEYANSNTSDVPYLEYKPITVGGQLAPSPQRAQYSVDLSNIAQSKQWIIEDIKAVTGIYDASIGNRSNETSGVAIRAREAQGNNANFHYIDNYAMAIAYEGRLINDALGIIYDTPRTITVRGEDEQEYLQEINTNESNMVGKGNFNLVVTVGPSFNTQREEQAAGMMEMFTRVPLVQNVASDLVVRSQDWVGKDALADRLEYATEQQMPGITTQSKPKGRDQELAFLTQKLNEATGQLQKMAQQGRQLQEALEKSQADKNAAAAGKIQVEMKKLELDQQRVMIDEQRAKGELMLREKEIDIAIMKADLDSETKLKINQDKLQVDLIKNETQPKQIQIEKPEKDNSRDFQDIKDMLLKMKEKKTITVKKNEKGEVTVDSEIK